jgi:hypothetical protein
MCTVGVDWQRLTNHRAVANFCTPAPRRSCKTRHALQIWLLSRRTLWIPVCTPAPLLQEGHDGHSSRWSFDSDREFGHGCWVDYVLVSKLRRSASVSGKQIDQRRARLEHPALASAIAAWQSRPPGGGTPPNAPHGPVVLPKACDDNTLESAILRTLPPKLDPHGLDACPSGTRRVEKKRCHRLSV